MSVDIANCIMDLLVVSNASLVNIDLPSLRFPVLEFKFQVVLHQSMHESALVCCLYQRISQTVFLGSLNVCFLVRDKAGFSYQASPTCISTYFGRIS